MKKDLDFNINRTGRSVGCIATPLSFIAITTRLFTLIGAGRRINRSLNNGGRRLGLYMRGGFRHSILWQGIRKHGNGQRCNLHSKTKGITQNTHSILLRSNEESFKYLVANRGLEKLGKNNLLSVFSCRSIL